MRKVKIITDSCSDLSAELLKKYDIDYAQMRTVYEGKETPARLEWTKEEALTHLRDELKKLEKQKKLTS